MTREEFIKSKIFKVIDKHVQGVDTYHNNGSMWFIFTDDKKWVIELTKEGTLWYNFYFFQDCFKYLSLDVVENQHYITEWVEDMIKNGVRSTSRHIQEEKELVEGIIQNGVRSTNGDYESLRNFVEDTIQNGVKETKVTTSPFTNYVEDTIENGVKHTEDSLQERMFFVEDTIENGVKETHHVDVMKFFDDKMNDTLQNGIKHNNKIIKETIDENHHRLREVVVTLKDGIKETKQEPSQRTWMSDNVIKDGIKETRTPNEHDFQATMDWLDHNNTTSVPFLINNIVNTGIKKTEGGIHFYEGTTDNVIKNGIKNTQPHVLEIINPIVFEPTIIECKRMNEVNIVLEKGVKNHK